MEATIKAIETIDTELKKLVETVLSKNGTIFITADHGNAEQMIDDKGNICTSHTTNPVPLWLVSEKYKNVELMDNGKLANIAPTVLKMLNLNIPKTMIEPLF